MRRKEGMPIQFKFARELRKNQTNHEIKIWDLLRNRKMNGFKFFRQFPIMVKDSSKFYIADFYCAEKNLVLEIDGPTHENQIEYDMLRNQIMNDMGYKVLRIKNEQIDLNLAKVIEEIISYLNE